MSQAPGFPPQPPQGMSKNTKLLLGLGIGFGFLGLLCCGGIAAVGVYFKDAISVSTDATVIEQRAGEIAKFKPPAGLAPEMSMRMQIPAAGKMSFVVYANKSKNEQLMLGEMQGKMAEGGPEQMRLQMQQQQAQQGKQGRDTVKIEQSEEHTREINGKPAKFVIASGKGSKSNEELWEISGDFSTKEGIGFVMFQAKKADYTKEQITEFLDSIE